MRFRRGELTLTERAIVFLVVAMPLLGLGWMARRPAPQLGSAPAANHKGGLRAHWRVSLDGEPLWDKVANVHDDGRGPFVVMVMRDRPHLVAYSALKGEELWDRDLGAGVTKDGAAAAVVGKCVVALTSDGEVRVIDRATGMPMGTLPAPRTSWAHVAGVDHAAITLGGSGVAVHVDLMSSASATRFNDVYVTVHKVMCSVTGAGRGVAVGTVLKDDGAVDMATDKVLFGIRQDVRAALVREKYIIVGGAGVWWLERSGGKTIESKSARGTVRRLDECAWRLYVLSDEDVLDVVHLDTREFLYRESNVAAFDYGMAGDFVMDASGHVRLLGEKGQTVGQLRLERTPLPSKKMRLRFNGTTLMVAETRAGGNFALAAYKM
jgi:hypothetical protein